MLIMILLIGYYGKLMAISLIPMGSSFCHAFVTLGLYDRPNPRAPSRRGKGGQASPGQASLDVHRAAKGGTANGPGEAWGEGLLEPPAFGP
jgi:hypothetical protein